MRFLGGNRSDFPSRSSSYGSLSRGLSWGAEGAPPHFISDPADGLVMIPSLSVLLIVALCWTIPATLAALFYLRGGAPFLSGSDTVEKAPMETACTDVLIDVSPVESTGARTGPSPFQSAALQNAWGPSGAPQFHPGRPRGDDSGGEDCPRGGDCPGGETPGAQETSRQMVSVPVPEAEATVTVTTDTVRIATAGGNLESRRCRVVLN